jgi:hypothetical protein
MKQYVIDQLNVSEYEKILDYLDKNAEKTVMGGIYRLEIPKEHSTPTQLEHTECQPHYFAVNLTLKRVAFELLIRSQPKIRCNCIAYATPQQRDYIIQLADNMMEQLNIRI